MLSLFVCVMWEKYMAFKKGKRLIQGVGINDADYLVSIKGEDGRETICPYYRAWTGMIVRCYSEKEQLRYPSYKDCTMIPEWLYFSEFKKWMESQDWLGKQLDKDLLVKDNKLYSPQTCVFLSPRLNTFLLDRKNGRGLFPLGVHYRPKLNKFVSQCSNGNGSEEYLGVYSTAEEAHEAWRAFKHKMACEYADQQTDSRVEEALRKRFSYEEWYKDKECKVEEKTYQTN